MYLIRKRKWDICMYVCYITGELCIRYVNFFKLLTTGVEVTTKTSALVFGCFSKLVEKSQFRVKHTWRRRPKLNVLFLRTSLHRTRTCYARCQGGKAVKCPTQKWY